MEIFMKIFISKYSNSKYSFNITYSNLHCNSKLKADQQNEFQISDSDSGSKNTYNKVRKKFLLYMQLKQG